MVSEILAAINLLGNALGIASWIKEHRKENEFKQNAEKIVAQATREDTNLAYVITEAIQKTKFSMNESGVNASSATAVSANMVEIIRGLLVIDPDLLKACSEALLKAAHQQTKDLRKYTEHDQTQHRYRADLRAQNLICETLNRIKRHNRGELPSVLGPYWRSYSCLDM